MTVQNAGLSIQRAGRVSQLEKLVRNGRFLLLSSWSKTRIFAAQLFSKSISYKLEREHKNNSQHQSNKMTQGKPINTYSPRLASNKSHNNHVAVYIISHIQH